MMKISASAICEAHKASDPEINQEGDAKRKRLEDISEGEEPTESTNRRLRRVPKRRKLLPSTPPRSEPGGTPSSDPTLRSDPEGSISQYSPKHDRYPPVRPAQHTKLPEANRPDSYPTFPYRHTVRSNICVLEGDDPADPSDRKILVSKQMLVPRSVWSTHRHQIIREHFSASLPCYADFPSQPTNGPVELVQISQQGSIRSEMARMEILLEKITRIKEESRRIAVENEALRKDLGMF
ncbi:unnamed protein product [Zymoseptoria tritici ST99CH_1E4]|uniref:Uncharacterized protein n=1 Tax=Zymoseptoria tritici ST99CH_1E4 TaxID=1276532 RepID=A0A2H1GCM7_ZYMTR|nr:unnamed protein product [Zymoseptoria tritici ST99CH_1E4]